MRVGIPHSLSRCRLARSLAWASIPQCKTPDSTLIEPIKMLRKAEVTLIRNSALHSRGFSTTTVWFSARTFFWPCNLPRERYNSAESVSKNKDSGLRRFVSAARKLLLATCIVGALIAVAAVVLSDSLSSDSTNVSNTDADRDTSNPQYPENLVVNENDAGGTVVTAKALGFAPGVQLFVLTTRPWV